MKLEKVINHRQGNQKQNDGVGRLDAERPQLELEPAENHQQNSQ